LRRKISRLHSVFEKGDRSDDWTSFRRDGPWTFSSGSPCVRSTESRPALGTGWFWIDNRNFASKRALSFMMVLLALSETGGGPAVPALTISTEP
jgi:hypothetical protein